jgi:hypothetical protein
MRQVEDSECLGNVNLMPISKISIDVPPLANGRHSGSWRWTEGVATIEKGWRNSGKSSQVFDSLDVSV